MDDQSQTGGNTKGGFGKILPPTPNKQNIFKQLQDVQQTLKAPKAQKNQFGNYMYRSCEDILEAVKPILKKSNCILIMTDTLVLVGDKNYVEATVSIINDEGGSLSVKAMAREAETRKGMDDAQITGAASSYARKYALNGLFAIDDTKDGDMKNAGKKQPTSPHLATLKKELKNAGAQNQKAALTILKTKTGIEWKNFNQTNETIQTALTKLLAADAKEEK